MEYTSYIYWLYVVVTICICYLYELIMCLSCMYLLCVLVISASCMD